MTLYLRYYFQGSPSNKRLAPHSISRHPIPQGPEQRHSCNTQTQRLGGGLSDVLMCPPIVVGTLRSFRGKGSFPHADLHLAREFPCTHSAPDGEAAPGMLGEGFSVTTPRSPAPIGRTQSRGPCSPRGELGKAPQRRAITQEASFATA